MNWAEILTIILSIVLVVFLLLGIALLVLLIRLTQQIKSVTASAQRTANGIEKAVAGLTRASSSGLILKTVLKQAQRMRRNKKEK